MISVFQNFNIRTVFLGVLFLLNPLRNEAETMPPNYTHIHSPLKVFCDLCGCSTSSGSSGFGTLDNLSFVGLRYMYQDYTSRAGIFSNSPKSEEHFNTYQVWGRIPVNQAFSLNVIVPYQDLYRNFEDRTEHINGLGDATLIGWYQFKFFKKHKNHEVDFNHDDAQRELSNHRLNLGMGLKIPTGAFEDMLTDRINPGFQVGTGSLDAIFSIMHSYSKNKLGVNTSATYYLKTENKNDYRFGNQFSFSSNMHYNLPLKTAAFSPFLGVSGDVYDSIKQFGEELPDTNGNIVNGTFGTEFMVSKFIVGANYTFPISQNLFGDNVTAKKRFMLYL